MKKFWLFKRFIFADNCYIDLRVCQRQTRWNSSCIFADLQIRTGRESDDCCYTMCCAISSAGQAHLGCCLNELWRFFDVLMRHFSRKSIVRSWHVWLVKVANATLCQALEVEKSPQSSKLSRQIGIQRRISFSHYCGRPPICESICGDQQKCGFVL